MLNLTVVFAAAGRDQKHSKRPGHHAAAIVFTHCEFLFYVFVDYRETCHGSMADAAHADLANDRRACIGVDACSRTTADVTDITNAHFNDDKADSLHLSAPA